MKTKHVVVLPYDQKWNDEFNKIKDELFKELDGKVISIEHVGSTSVKGLSAKPIIDIDIVINDYASFDEVLHGLNRLGYAYEGNLGIPGREAFKYENKPQLMIHHIYVCTKDSTELRRHILFRDYLRCHNKAVEEYSRIKEEAAALYPDNIEKYIEYKSPVIEKLYKEAGIV